MAIAKRLNFHFEGSGRTEQATVTEGQTVGATLKKLGLKPGDYNMLAPGGVGRLLHDDENLWPMVEHDQEVSIAPRMDAGEANW